MPNGSGQDRLDDYARALPLVEAFLKRRARGEEESTERFLERNKDLREILAAMLAVEESEGSPPSYLKESRESWTGFPEKEEEFGPYRIVEMIGQGGMGTVFLAEQLDLERKVALKLIRPERLCAAVAKVRFWREAKAASKLDHPNICPVFDVGEVKGMPYMAMRYLEGRTLGRMIAHARKRTTPETREDKPSSRKEINILLEIMEKTAQALHFAHEKGIIHRDIKPGNIMVTDDGEPMVMDFGLARDEESDEHSLTMTGDLPGTPMYMSPEQIAPRGRQLDRTTDIYSLGATLYECLTLRPAFEGSSLHDLQGLILNSDPVRPSRTNRHIPRDLEVVLEKAMDKDRERRYRTARDFAEDLARVRRLEPVKARPAGILHRMRRWIQRNPVAASFVFFLVIASLGTGFMLVQAKDRLQQIIRLSDVKKLTELQQEEEELWPAFPEMVPKMEAWLEAAGLMMERLHIHQETLEHLYNKLPPFDDPALVWQSGVLQEMVSGLKELADPRSGRIKKVKDRLAFATTIEERSIHQHRKAWDQAVASIKNKKECPKYKGLVIKPILGLVPIGPDPKSNLWEFVHLQTGEIPKRGEDGKLLLTEEAGLVFVLIPGGTYEMSVMVPSETIPLKAAATSQRDRLFLTTRSCAVKPFLISKYEMTQGQWQRFAGDNPSLICAGERVNDHEINLLHPVDNVSWEDCVKVLGRMNLRLPLQSEWEYAARAGTNTDWWTGNSPSSLEGAANVSDEAYENHRGPSRKMFDSWNDGYPYHAPVGVFRANAFGLHDVIGNLCEWCQDGFDTTEFEELEPLYISISTKTRFFRGGCWHSPGNRCPVFSRKGHDMGFRDPITGVRPAASLD